MKNNVLHFVCLAVVFFASSFVAKPDLTGPCHTGLSYGGIYVVFAGKYGGEITKTEVAGQTELKVEGCHKDARILGFTLSVTKSGKTSTLVSTSKVLTTEMRDKLKSLNKGDEFEFRNTKAYLQDGRDAVEVRGSKFKVV